jgi:hypothetical protein
MHSRRSLLRSIVSTVAAAALAPITRLGFGNRFTPWPDAELYIDGNGHMAIKPSNLVAINVANGLDRYGCGDLVRFMNSGGKMPGGIVAGQLYQVVRGGLLAVDEPSDPSHAPGSFDPVKGEFRWGARIHTVMREEQS